MGAQDKPVTAYILSLIGGLLILVGSIIAFTWFMYGGAVWGVYGGMMGGMMGGYQGMMGSFGVPLGFTLGFSLMGLVSGIIIIVSTIMLSTRPSEHVAWGTIILIFSVISFLGMGGFFVGAILGLVGGAFAISWKPKS